MKTFKFSFIGRQARAIGVFYKIEDSYKANNLSEALYKLYTDYEHISQIKVNGEALTLEEVNKTGFTKCEHSKRKTHPKTGTYI